MFRTNIMLLRGFEGLKGGFDQGDVKNKKEPSSPALALYQLPLISTVQSSATQRL